jgi:hypothetical protein
MIIMMLKIFVLFIVCLFHGSANMVDPTDFFVGAQNRPKLGKKIINLRIKLFNL